MSVGAPTIVLVGLMGTGKTTVARLLAEHYGIECLDTDRLVEQRAGRSVRSIFDSDGEPAFRILESEVLETCLRTPGGCVIAGAGGVVLREQNRSALRAASARGAQVVWLRAAPELLAKRTARGQHRPLLDTDREGTLRRMADERTALYSEVADITVDVSERSAESVARLVIAAVDEAVRMGGHGDE